MGEKNESKFAERIFHFFYSMKITLKPIFKFFFFVLLFSFLSCRKDEEMIAEITNSGPHPYNLTIPGGFFPMPIPPTNPLTQEGVFLGRKLFYDPILSLDSSQSCASCHRQNFSFTDSTLLYSMGVNGVSGTRNAMPLFNLGWTTNGFFWDGGASNLESQVADPITNPIEMHETLANVVFKLQRNSEYPPLFEAAFGNAQISSAMILKAIAQFERTLISGNSRFDKWYRGEIGGFLTTQEMNGMNLFTNMQKGDCQHCHPLGNTFTDFQFRNTGLDSIAQDSGRYRITYLQSDIGKFKTPSLRNIEFTSPYMHDGRFSTLEEVIDHYNSNFKYPVNLDPALAHIPKNRLSNQEKSDIVAFLKTLSDFEFLTNPAHHKP